MCSPGIKLIKYRYVSQRIVYVLSTISPKPGPTHALESLGDLEEKGEQKSLLSAYKGWFHMERQSAGKMVNRDSKY